MAKLELRILGPIEVRHDGSPVKVRGTKPRELLALLAIRPNRPVTAEQLVDELWRNHPPPSAATALRVHIGRLRQALEPGRNTNSPSARLPAVPHGYLLRIEPDELDAQHFERLVLLAREAIAAGDPAGAVPQLTHALDLWRGSALSDIEDIAAARGEIARLEDLRAVAIEELADARLALGEHALVVDLVGVALTQFPLRERLTASLMLALYRSGRQAEALHAYAELARRLDDELGLAPSPELRQLEEDVLLHRPSLHARSVRAAPQPMPIMRRPIGRFIGRRIEVSRLLDAYDAANAGTANLILVSGAAGVGKTTLTEEFCARTERRGSGPLVGHCDSEPGADYQPIAEILRQVLEHVDSRTRSSLPSQLGLLLPDPIDRAPGCDNDRDTGDGAQFRLFETVATTLATLVERPRVLIVEDVHWADRPTLRLLRHLVRHRDLDGMLVIATYRDDEIDGERVEMIEQLARSAQRTKIDLTGFDDHEVRALVRATAPPETLHVLVDLAATLHDVTGGNPFFLRELLRELDEQFVKLNTAEQLSDTLTTIAPVGVRALVDRRRERLTTHADQVIKAAATLGRELTVDALAGICRLSKEVTLEALEEGLAARLLVEDYQQVDRYLFPHALVRNAVYATIPVAECRQLHRRVAQALEGAAIPGSIWRSADIAHHYLEAAPLGLQHKAAAHAERAGHDAASRFAFAEAARWYERALELHAAVGAPDDETGRLHLALGRSLTNDKQHELAQHALLTAAECARRSSDPNLLAEVALTTDNPWALGEDYQPDVLALLEEALAAVDEVDTELRVRLLDGIATNLYYIDTEREGRVAQTALDLATRVDRPAVLAPAYRSMHLWCTHQPEAREERLAVGRRAHDLACSADEAIRLRLVAHRGLVVDLLENQEIDEFETTLHAYEEAAHLLGSPQDIYWAMALRSTEMTMHGDLAAAEQLARGAMLRGHELDQISDGAYLLQRFVVRYQQGRLAEEAPVLREASAASTVFRAGAALHATALVETGQPKRALEIARSTLEADGSGLPRDAFWLAGVSLFAGVAATAIDRELSELLRELLKPCAEHVVLFGAGAAMLGAGHHWLGGLAATLDDTDAALDHYAEARAIAQRLSAPYWMAQSVLDAAAARRTRDKADDKAKADRLLAEAIAIAETYGYGRVLKQAEPLR